MPRTGRRDQILAAAKTLFSTKGYHGTTIRDIAEESGMLSGSLYAHITAKEDLLFEIMDDGAARFLDAIEPIAAAPGPAASKLEQAMAAHILLAAGGMDTATVFLHEWKALDPERRSIIQEKRDRYEAALTSIIHQGVLNGEFRPVDEKFARLLVLSAVNWLYAWYDPRGPLRPDEVARKFVDLILRGLLDPGGGAQP